MTWSPRGSTRKSAKAQHSSSRTTSSRSFSSTPGVAEYRKPDAALGLALLDQGVVRQGLPDAPALGARLRSLGASWG
jgi:hypothetical protein